MKQETVFVVDGKIFGKIKEVAAHLGLKSLARRDFVRKGIVEVTPEEAEKLVAKQDIEKEVEQKVAQKVEEVIVEETKKEEEVKAEEQEQEPKAEEPKKAKAERKKAERKKAETPKKETKKETKANKKKAKQPTEEQLKRAKELRELTGYDTIESLWIDIEEMDEKQVATLAKQLNITWKEDAHSGINRMRACMAIRNAMFPGQKRPKKAKSPYRGVPIAELRELAKAHNLAWRQSDNEHIEKMWLVHALKEAGVTPKQ